MLQSRNPHTGESLRTYEPIRTAQLEECVQRAEQAFRDWRVRPFAARAEALRQVACVLRERATALALLMADEMGKPLRDGAAEIEKCAVCCEYYAEHGADFLREERVPSDARESSIGYEPLGVVLAVMPWNFPFWQVFRFAAPAVMAGNVGILKHASNVSGCALAIQEVFRAAGVPPGVFSTVLLESARVEALIRHPFVRAVTLTGSAPAGRAVARAAGDALKKSVLELGGSDAYVVLEDADLELAVRTCVASRLINAGQSCIAAKRFIVERRIRMEFEQRFVEQMAAVRFGDPRDPQSNIGPLARHDLRDDVHDQVVRSVRSGARVLLGGTIPAGPGAYYPPTVLSAVVPGMAAFDEETFGPVAAIVEAADLEHAIELANRSKFGLGAALFTRDKAKADRVVPRLEAGSVFVNALVKSDPRLPFGGVKESGYGRELSFFGIREFVNIKTIYHGRAPERLSEPGHHAE